MTTGQLLSAGLACCVIALSVQLFPDAAHAIGVDIGASWRLFGFGIFLIAIAALIGLGASRRSDRDR